MNKKRNIFIIVVLTIFILIGIKTSEKKEPSIVYVKKEHSQIAQKNILSMMLEKESGSKEYELVTRSEWPTHGYIFNETLSKCENGGDISWDNTNKLVLFGGSSKDRCYVYFDKLQTISNYIKSLYTGKQGENNLYYHNGTITSEDGTILDANDNSYRYAGASTLVNNYVCFGNDEEICPIDNLYRIIGVFDNQVKLIKADYASSNLLGTDGDYYGSYTYGNSTYLGNNYSNIASYYWNFKATNSGINDWSTSLLNKTNLNKNFLNNIGSNWESKIVETTWKIGGNTWENIGSVIPATAYLNEVINQTTIINAKIGLIYISDYGFSASPSSWATILSSYNNSNITAVNWMHMGLYEWTISRRSDYTPHSLSIHSDDRADVSDVYSCKTCFLFRLNCCLF